MSFWAGVLLAPLIWYVIVVVITAITMAVGGVRQWFEDRAWHRLVNEVGVARAVELHAEKKR